MTEQQGSSSIDIDSLDTTVRDRDPNFDSDIESPLVTLTTPFPQSAIRTHAATLRKLQEQEREIKAQQRKIQELTFTIAIQDAHTHNVKASEKISRTPSAPPALTETPGPHRLQMKPERPEDVAYRAKVAEQTSAEKAMGENEDNVANPDNMLTIFQALTKVLKDNSQHLQSSDVTDPTKFNGLDTQWEDFYLQFRTFLEAKGWLTTFDHPTGPDTPGFDNEVNKKIYNKLLALCNFAAKAPQLLTSQKLPPQMAGKQENWLPRRVLHSTRFDCGSPGLWVLQMGTVGYCGYCGYCAVPTVPVGTAGYCGYCGYCKG